MTLEVTEHSMPAGVTRAVQAEDGVRLVRKEGLEPSWVSPPDPKSGASANSATFALFVFYNLRDLFLLAFLLVTDLVTSCSNDTSPLNRCLGMLRGEVTVSHGHPNCTVTHELRDSAEVYSSHDQTRRERVPVTVPRVGLQTCLLNRWLKRSTDRVERVSIGIPEDWPDAVPAGLSDLNAASATAFNGT